MLTPRLVAPTDSVDLPSVAVVGRRYYYYSVRSGLTPMLTADDLKYRAEHAEPVTVSYAKTIGYEPWMDQADLRLLVTTADGCTATTAPDRTLSTRLEKDTTVIRSADREERGSRLESLSGQANVKFVVNRTELNPDYMGNRREIDRILQSLADVQRDTLNTLVGLTLKGYASPEGSYDHNAWLAENRTAALARFIASEFSEFSEDSETSELKITTDFEPEDWQGMRHFVATDNRIQHKHEILTLIDTPMDPDEQLHLIATRYAEDYRLLLSECFPALRRTDYRIDYTHRIDTVRTVASTDPAQLLVALPEEQLRDDLITLVEPTIPLFALKTNLLFDALLTFNIEAELPLGRQSNYSLMAEYWTPWYVWHHNSRAYELQVVGLELRRWLSPRCVRPVLSGTFAGLYAAVGKYDFEWNSDGNQAEFISVGLSAGYSWVLSKSWNFEASLAVGALWGPRSHYRGRFDDTHLIWDHDSRDFYFGPTKLKLSLVWLIPQKKKGGKL